MPIVSKRLFAENDKKHASFMAREGLDYSPSFNDGSMIRCTAARSYLVSFIVNLSRQSLCRFLKTACAMFLVLLCTSCLQSSHTPFRLTDRSLTEDEFYALLNDFHFESDTEFGWLVLSAQGGFLKHDGYQPFFRNGSPEKIPLSKERIAWLSKNLTIKIGFNSKKGYNAASGKAMVSAVGDTGYFLISVFGDGLRVTDTTNGSRTVRPEEAQEFNLYFVLKPSASGAKVIAFSSRKIRLDKAWSGFQTIKSVSIERAARKVRDYVERDIQNAKIQYPTAKLFNLGIVRTLETTRSFEKDSIDRKKEAYQKQALSTYYKNNPEVLEKARIENERRRAEQKAQQQTVAVCRKQAAHDLVWCAGSSATLGGRSWRCFSNYRSRNHWRKCKKRNGRYAPADDYRTIFCHPEVGKYYNKREDAVSSKCGQ